MRWYKIFFGMFLLAFFSFVGFSSSVYAIDDVTYHFDSSYSGGSWRDVCRTYGDVKCSDYSYIVVKFNDLSFTDIRARNIYLEFNFQQGYESGSSISPTGGPRCYPFVNSTCVFGLQDWGFNANTSVGFYSNVLDYYASGWSYDVILTNQLGEPCPEPDPCPEPEQCPATPYADKFDNIEKAIYTCGAILIMLYFFYCIYRMIIKGSGVN